VGAEEMRKIVFVFIHCVSKLGSEERREEGREGGQGFAGRKPPKRSRGIVLPVHG